MEKFYITMEINAEDQASADNCAEILSNIGVRVMGCYPGFDPQLDNHGQVVIYTGYIHPTHGA